jgi:hypothetical protein
MERQLVPQFVLKKAIRIRRSINIVKQFPPRLPKRLTTYLPMKPVQPKTVTTNPVDAPVCAIGALIFLFNNNQVEA